MAMSSCNMTVQGLGLGMSSNSRAVQGVKMVMSSCTMAVQWLEMGMSSSSRAVQGSRW